MTTLKSIITAGPLSATDTRGARSTDWWVRLDGHEDLIVDVGVATVALDVVVDAPAGTAWRAGVRGKRGALRSGVTVEIPAHVAELRDHAARVGAYNEAEAQRVLARVAELEAVAAEVAS